MTLEHGLERWEAGEVSLPELERDHPGSRVAGLVALHDRLSELAAEPVTMDEGALQGLLARLPLREPAGRRPRRARRAILLAVAAALLMSSVALAAPGVREGLVSLAHNVGRLLTGPENRVLTPLRAPPSTSRVPSTSNTGHIDGSGESGHPGTSHASSGTGEDGDGSAGSGHTGSGDGESDSGRGSESESGSDQTGGGDGDQQADGSGSGDHQDGDATSGDSQGGSGDSSGDSSGDGSDEDTSGDQGMGSQDGGDLGDGGSAD